MKKGNIIGIIIAVIVISAIVVVMMAYNNGTSKSSTHSSSSSSTTSAVATNAVDIQNFAFSPSDITVKVGATVTWTNKDSVAHTVTSDNGSVEPFDSGNVAQGGVYSHTFNTVGTFTYHCTVHPSMTGKVTVTQ